MITDEMKVSAVKAYTEVDGKCRPAAMQKALEAALPFLPIAGEGKVKALEWTGEEGGPGHDVYAKPSGYHHYTVRHLSEAKFDVILHTDTGSIWFAQEKRGNYHGTYAEAKTAAQADYDLRGAEFSSPGKDGGQEVEAVPVPDGWVLVQQAALDWLFGEGPDPAGFHFGDWPEDIPRPQGAFWWRSVFRQILASSPPPQPASTALVERLQMALERLITAIEREPVVGDLDYPHAHNDWLGWRKKILRPTASAAKAVLSASQSTSREGESRG